MNRVVLAVVLAVSLQGCAAMAEMGREITRSQNECRARGGIPDAWGQECISPEEARLRQAAAERQAQRKHELDVACTRAGGQITGASGYCYVPPPSQTCYFVGTMMRCN